LTKLVFCWFFEIKLENGLSHDRNRWEKIGKDTKRYRKIGKGGKRWEKMAIDCSLIGEYGFSLVANANVLLNCRFPYLGGSRDVSDACMQKSGYLRL
jgi:hypothetical protein